MTFVPTRSGRPRRVLLVVLSAAIALGGCTVVSEPRESTGSTARTVDLGGGAILEVPSGSLPADAVVDGALTAPVTGLPSGAALPAAATLSVTSSAQPTAPVMVHIPVPAGSWSDSDPAADGAVLVWHRHGDEPWEPLVGRLDRTSSTVNVATSKLSTFVPVFASLSGMAGVLAKLANGFLGGLVLRTDPPSCDGEQAARTAGYTARSSSGDAVRWCLGLGPRGPELRVVANRRYAMAASPGRGLTLRSSSGGTLSVGAAQALTTVLQPGQAVLSPGGTSVFDVVLAPGGSTTLRTGYDGFTQSLVALQLGVELGLESVGAARKGATTAVETVRVIDFSRGGCIIAMRDVLADVTDDERLGTMIQSCLDPAVAFRGVPEKLLPVLKGLLAPIGKTVAFFLTSATSVRDLASGADAYRITVSRAGSGGPGSGASGPGGPSGREPVTGGGATGVFPTGDWSRRFATLSLRHDGTGTISYRMPGLPQATGCTESSASTETCFYHATFRVGTDGRGPWAGTIIARWFTEGTTPVTTTDHPESVPDEGDSVSIRSDPAANKVFYTDPHQAVDLCGVNRTRAATDCS